MISILDGFASAEELHAVNAAWPGADWPGWVRYDPATACKQASNPAAVLPAAAAVLLHRMATMRVEPAGLTPDLGLWGAGLHEMPPGPGLASHIDATRHALLGLERVLSAVLYLSPWEPDWGGTLELPGLSISPLPGRLVMFDCRQLSHRVAPVTCQSRRSLALFWYGSVCSESLPCRATFG